MGGGPKGAETTALSKPPHRVAGDRQLVDGNARDVDMDGIGASSTSVRDCTDISTAASTPPASPSNTHGGGGRAGDEADVKTNVNDDEGDRGGPDGSEDGWRRGAKVEPGSSLVCP